MTPIPTAKQAREEALSVQNAANEEVLNKVAADISVAKAQGRLSVGGDGTLPDPVKKYLESLGYKVQHGTQYNESHWSVSW